MTSKLNIDTNIMRRKRETRGNMKSPSFTVPDEQRNAKHNIEEIWKRIFLKLEMSFLQALKL